MALPQTLVMTALASDPISGTLSSSIIIFDSANHAQPQVFFAGVSGSLGPLAFAEHSSRLIEYTPLASTTLGPVRGSIGGAFGTVSHPTPTTATDLLSSMYRTRFTSGTGTNNPAGIAIPVSGSTSPSIWRGNAPGRGGFFIAARFATTTGAHSGSRGFCGLGNAIHAVNPSTLFDTLGMMFDDGDPIAGNWYFGRNGGGGTATRVDLGSGARRSDANIYDCYMYAPPASESVAVAIVNLSSGTVLLNTSYSDDLPTNSTMLFFEIVKNAANSGQAQIMDIQRIHIWSHT